MIPAIQLPLLAGEDPLSGNPLVSGPIVYPPQPQLGWTCYAGNAIGLLVEALPAALTACSPPTESNTPGPSVLRHPQVRTQSFALEDIMFCISCQPMRRYQAIPHRFTPINWWLSLLGVSTVVVLIALMISRSYIAHQALNLDEAGRVSGCEARMLYAIKPQPETINLAVLGSVHSLCYQDVAGEDVLTDFGIRKSAYLNQQVQTTILMWMVVAITTFGVISQHFNNRGI